MKSELCPKALVFFIKVRLRENNVSEAMCLMDLKMRNMSRLKIFMYFRDLEYWLQRRGEKTDVTKGWIVKELQYQAMRNGLKYMEFEVNFENKDFLSDESTWWHLCFGSIALMTVWTIFVFEGQVNHLQIIINVFTPLGRLATLGR